MDKSRTWAMWALAGAQAWLAVLCLIPPTRGTWGSAQVLTASAFVTLAILTAATLNRLPAIAVDLDLALSVVALLTFVAQQANPQISVQMGTGLVLLGAIAAAMLSPGRLGAHIGIYAAGYLIAATTDAVLGSAVMAAAMVTCLAGVAAVVAVLVSRQSRSERRLADSALRDPLTGALSRGATAVEASTLHAMALRHETALSAVLIQFDHPSWYGGAEGSDAEASLLQSVAVAWRDVLRTGDVLGRVGVDEFLLLLPETDVFHAGALLTRLREAHSAPWSFAVVQWRTQETFNDLLARVTKDLQRRRKQRSLR